VMHLTFTGRLGLSLRRKHQRRRPRETCPVIR